MTFWSYRKCVLTQDHNSASLNKQRNDRRSAHPSTDGAASYPEYSANVTWVQPRRAKAYERSAGFMAISTKCPATCVPHISTGAR